MTPFDWTGYVTGGATRPDAISGLDGQFQNALARMLTEAPENVRGGLRLSSAYRSPERQEQLWQEALAKYGTPEKARKWVAPPGKSQHNSGRAADLKYLSDDAKAWVHANAGQYGLAFPMDWEPWHIELAGARGQQMAEAPGQMQQTQQTQQPQQNALAKEPEPFRPTIGRQDPRAFQTQQNALAVMPIMTERPNYLTRRFTNGA